MFDANVTLSIYMAQLANVMTVLAHELVSATKSYPLADRSRIAELSKTSRDASGRGKAMLAESTKMRHEGVRGIPQEHSASFDPILPAEFK